MGICCFFLCIWILSLKIKFNFWHHFYETMLFIVWFDIDISPLITFFFQNLEEEGNWQPGSAIHQ